MYSEEIRAARGGIIAFSILGIVPLVALVVVLVLVRMPIVGRLAIVGAMLLEAATVWFLIASLSLTRIEITREALTVRYRFLFRTRVAVHRIATCGPIVWRGFGISYTNAGTQTYSAPAGTKNAVRLKLTNKAEVVFSTRHPDTVCETLRALRPEIAPNAPIGRRGT